MSGTRVQYSQTQKVSVWISIMILPSHPDVSHLHGNSGMWVLHLLSSFSKLEKTNLQKSIDEGIDGSREFTEYSWNHVHIRGHQVHVPQGREDEDKGVGCPREKPNTHQAATNQVKFLKRLSRFLEDKIENKCYNYVSCTYCWCF